MSSQEKKSKVAIAGFQLESVSHLPTPTTLADFEAVALRGSNIVTQLRGTNTVMGGFIKICEQSDIEMMPIVQTSQGAAGAATDEAVEFYIKEISAAIEKHHTELDGVLLFLHGACWSPGFHDPEKVIISRIRKTIGPDKPLVVAFDYHGNLSRDSIEGADGVFAYRKSPHTDAGQTGERAADCMARILRGEIKPSVHLVKPGVLVPSIFSATDLRPLADIIAQGHKFQEKCLHYLDISIMAGFSYTDAPNTGFSVMCTADEKMTDVAATIRALSDAIHENREALYRPVPVYNCKEGFERIEHAISGRKQRGKPFVLLEHADRVNDSSYILEELLNRRPSYKVSVPFLWDPEAAALANKAGVGQTVRLRLGGHSSAKAGPRLEVDAKVIWVGQKSYRNSGSYMKGLPVNLGLTALLDVEGMSVSVTTESHTALNGDPFYIFDQQPSDFDLIVLRSKTHFRAFYEEASEEILIVDTPDYGPADLTTVPYQFLDTASVYPFNASSKR
jgi:microcystin degradation protein MlrC